MKSLHVTNKSASNTPTISITNNGFQVINTQTLVAATSVEILTNPMIVEGNTVLSYTTVGTVTDGVDITISYLNINCLLNNTNCNNNNARIIIRVLLLIMHVLLIIRVLNILAKSHVLNVVVKLRKLIVMDIVFLVQEIYRKMIFVRCVQKNVGMIKEMKLIESFIKNTAI
mgnify:CR=1 FL=1